MITDLKDLHNLFFNEWKLPFIALNNVELISESNPILKYYANNFGASVSKYDNQDSLEISKNSTDLELTNFLVENSGNWDIAVHKKTDNLYTNEQWLYTESKLSDYEKLNFGIEECLISFSLQEVYFEFSQNTKKTELELNLKPLWIGKRYSSNDKTHSFYYDSEFKALKFVHIDNDFKEVAFIR